MCDTDVATRGCSCGNDPDELASRSNVKKGKRDACQQKAATVLTNRTAATQCIYSSLSSFEFDIIGYGAPYDGKIPLQAAPKCRPCHGNSEILDRRSFRSDATLFFL